MLKVLQESIRKEWIELCKDEVLEEHNLLLTEALNQCSISSYVTEAGERVYELPKVIRDLQELIEKEKLERVKRFYPQIYKYLWRNK